MGQQWEPAGDSERLSWVAARLLWHGECAVTVGRRMLWLPHHQGPLSLCLMLCHLWGVQGACEPTLVTRLRWDRPVQLTDPATIPPLRWSLLAVTSPPSLGQD